MVCPKCKSENVQTQYVQTNARTRQRNTGCLWSIGRACLILCTGGLWLLVGKRKGTGDTTFTNKKIAVCQNCGYTWDA